MALPGTGTVGRRFCRLQGRMVAAATAQSQQLAEIDSVLAARLLHLDVVEWLEPVGEVQRRLPFGAAVVCRRDEKVA